MNILETAYDLFDHVKVFDKPDQSGSIQLSKRN